MESETIKKLKQQKPVIGYWAIRGLIAPAYYILEYLGVEYEKVEYVQGDDFNNEAWLKEKFNLGLEFPNLPYMIHGDFKITESVAILRYLCEMYGPELLGKDAKDKAVVDMVVGVLHDIKSPVGEACYRTGNREAAAKLVTERMARVSDLLKARKFVVGDYITMADFVLFEYEELFNWIAEGKMFELYPSLKEHHDRVAELPKFASYYKSPRFMVRPFNNKVAKLNN